MAGKFIKSKFNECSLNDSFFETLKSDYPEFQNWFKRKAAEGAEAFVFKDECGISAFVYLKQENEKIELEGTILPAKKRLKIGTLKLDSRYQGQRLGEGAIGISLWNWQAARCSEIYLTVYKEHKDVIALVKKFGFVCAGRKKNGEFVYIKNREKIDYGNPQKSFPFVNPAFQTAGMLPVFDYLHDRLFPYSELKNTNQEFWEEAAGNGITKIFIGQPHEIQHLIVGTPVFLYRISTEEQAGKTYRSCITSFATISKRNVVKIDGKENISLESFLELCGNKTIFDRSELKSLYERAPMLVMFELVYNGFFGKGHNVTHHDLSEKGLFPCHPYNIKYSQEEFKKILRLGGKDYENIIIN